MRKLTLGILMLGAMLLVAGFVSAIEVNDYDSVRPILECVKDAGDGNYVAYFGYLNENDMRVEIPVGENNFFTPGPQDRGQTIEFLPGRTPYYPDAEFNVAFDGSNLVWTLEGPDGSRRTSTASANSQECPDCEIVVTEPQVGMYYSDPIGIEWEADYCTSPTYNIHYKEGDCGIFPSTDWQEVADTINSLDYSWMSGIEEGEFCIRVSEDEGAEFGVMEGTFYIDNLIPVADANGPYTCDEGDYITLDGSASMDPGEYASGISTWEWYVDGEYVGEGETIQYLCEDGDALLDVELVVTDGVGLTDNDYSEIEVSNVDPWDCSIMADHSDVALGFPVEFEGYADDVDADIPLDFYWDFGDSENDNGMNVEHTFNNAGMHEVVLTVSDKDGGETDCFYEVDVVEPIHLMNQEVAAYYPLMADFGEDSGTQYGDRGSFMTDLTGVGHTDCEKIVGPENFVTSSLADGECVVVWDNDEIEHPFISANPTNDEQGDHTVVIRVEGDEGSYEYYTFTVTVYSWIIDLEEGWNLVSIPYVPTDTSIESVILDQLGDEGQDILPGGTEYVVWSYQYNDCAECGSGSEWLKSGRSGFGDLDTVVPGYGYWIKTNAEGKLRGFGSQIAQSGEFPGMPPEVELPTNGWALIGRYGILGMTDYHYPGETCWDAGAIPKMVALESLTKLDNELHVFDVTEDAHLNEVYQLWNNMGYWLWVEDEALDNAESETYAPLDKYYMEDLNCEMQCLGDCQVQLI